MTIETRSFRYSLDTDASVATITLDRPDRLNALTFEVYEELRDTFRALDTEPGVRAIVITGAGRAHFVPVATSRISSARCSSATAKACWNSPP